MTVGNLLLLVELAAPLFMVGVFWAMQILNYPSPRLAPGRGTPWLRDRTYRPSQVDQEDSGI